MLRLSPGLLERDAARLKDNFEGLEQVLAQGYAFTLDLVKRMPDLLSHKPELVKHKLDQLGQTLQVRVVAALD